MQLTLTGRHIEITPAIRERAETLFSRLNNHYPCHQQRLSFAQEHGQFNVQVEYRTDRGPVNASAEADNLYNAMQQATDKLGRQLERMKPRH